MKTLMLKINGLEVSASEGSTILDAARSAGIMIPTLCHVKGLCSESACRICVVELSNGRLVPACSTAVQDGMDIRTDSQKVRKSRHQTMELLCMYHRMDCDNCIRYTDCEFHDISTKAGINTDEHETFLIPPEKDVSSKCIVRDISKCIMCRRCAAACSFQEMNLISAYGRGPITKVGTVLPFSKSGCVNCGQCVAVCPTASLYEVRETHTVWNMLRNKKRETAAVLTPEVAAMISEAFHSERESGDGARLSALLRRMGFEYVYSTVSAAEYRNALLTQESGKRETVIDAACPSVEKMIRMRFPKTEDRLSAVPSAAAVTAEHIRADHPGAYVVYISTCIAVKEIKKDWGIDAALTVPELVSMIHRACVSRATAIDVWRRIGGSDYDHIALPEMPEGPDRTAHQVISGLAKVRKFLEGCGSARGVVSLQACPEGCINGGGQLRQTSAQLSEGDLTGLRKAFIADPQNYGQII